ncbi:MAG: ABC transporter ATP-binding protein, partial [Chloroflexi bacterium]|nr:ABC transporter ATP-binding protein [Chloroflexota bacterium]
MSNHTYAIVVRNLVKRYGKLAAVDDIGFEVGTGEIFGLLGPNGAGKTTTVECIEGLRAPDQGEIEVMGLNPHRDRSRIKERIGIQLQTTGLYPKLTVREVIDLFASFFKRTLPTDQIIDMTGLREKMNTRSKDLSGGQRQRLSVALALINDPDLVFLDEPTTGLDPQARRRTWDVIEQLRSQGKTILMTTHYLDEAERLCDRVAVVDHGKIIAMDKPQELIRQHFHEQAIEFRSRNQPPETRLRGLAGVT